MKAIRKLTMVLTIATLLCNAVIPAYAAQTDELDLDATGTINVALVDSEAGEACEDGVLTLYRIADAAVEDDALTYTYTAAFSDCDGDLSDITDSSLIAILEFYIADNAIAGTKETICDGCVVFSELSPGLYLIQQTETSEGFYTIDSFLVALPAEDGDEWNYNVEVYPKVEKITTTVTETPETEETTTDSILPQTGMMIAPVIALAVLGAGAYVIGFFMAFGKRKKKKNDTQA